MKKILSLALALTMLLGLAAPVSAASPYTKEGDFLKDLGVLRGTPSGDLMLEQNLKREEMVVLISRLYGEEDEAEFYVANNTFPDLRPEHGWAIPYILWARDEGLIQGDNTGRFGITESVTVQQFQTVLLRSLGYNEEAKDWHGVPAFAQSIGIMKGLSFSKDATLNRGQVAAMVVNALSLNMKGSSTPLAAMLGLNPIDITETTVIRNDRVTFSGRVNDDEIDELQLNIRPKSTSQGTAKNYDIPLDLDGDFSFDVDGLVLGEYEYRYYTDTKATSYKSFRISSIQFDLTDVYADNLKEIKLKFNKAVDTTLASSTYNYSTSAGTINNVRFEDSDRTIVLVLNGTMTDNNQYTIKAANILSESGEAIDINEAFGASDDDAPRVTGIDVLGYKGIRIYFSEPIRTIPTMNNFSFNQTNTLGNPVLEDNHITLSYSSTSTVLQSGTYSIETSGLEDYSGKRMNVDYRQFKVDRDKVAPAVDSINVTTERVTLVFSEDIDPSATQGSNIFQREGTSINYADEIIIDGNKVVGLFEKQPFPTKEISLYVNTFADYWGNMMEIKEFKLTPKDETRDPEVLSAIVSEDGKTIRVTYNKNVKANDTSYYSLRDSSGRNIFIRQVTGEGREFTLELYTTLPAGDLRLDISGVKDLSGTTIKDYRTTLEMKDLERPRLLNYTGYGNIIVMEFDKEMDRQSASYTSNYVMTFDGSELPLSSGTNIYLDDAGNTLTLTLPDTISGKDTMVGMEDNLTKLEVVGLRSVSGNLTNPLLLSLEFDESSTGEANVVDFYSSIPGKQAVLTEPEVVKVKFNMPIIEAAVTDFDFDGIDVSRVIADGTNVVTIILGESVTTIEDGDASIVRRNNIRTSIDTGVAYGGFDVHDEVAPMLVSKRVDIRNGNLEIEFSEDLEDDGASLYRRDIEVTRLADNKVLSEDEYATTLDSSYPDTLIISPKSTSVESEYAVRVIDSPSYIRDLSGNLVLPSSPIETNDTL
ncbi:S-layer homology domain-containing protein [Gudongella sp. DL1XJH-153]|uniref:S-layer homology domain-containing protein n=1 Tax=Gudongella sp. DL1XJH-153 TaxID=3409804 RepID=UPI003BB71728